MNKRLICSVAAALFVSVACSSPSRSTNTATTNSAAQSANANSATTPSAANSPGATAQQANQDFTLVNSTGVEINAVYISPHDSDDWEEDILGRDTLPNGDSVHITFNRSEKAARWDLRIEDKEGNPIEWENLNLLEISKITLHYTDNKATAEIE